jgi:hypothetical protein
MEKKIKYILFGSIFFVLLFSTIQKEFQLFKFEPLEGAFIPKKEPLLTWKSWSSGDFQKRYSKYYEENIGFRKFFVRVNNQIDYSVFSKANTVDVVVGKENVLYQAAYIRAILGRDYVGRKKVAKRMKRLKFVHDALEKQGTTLIVLFAPGKATIYPEYIPWQYDMSDKDTTNYEVFKKELLASGMNFLDLRAHFIQLKKKAKYPLFPKCGVHWSGYGLTLAADTLFSYIEQKRGIDMIDFHSEKGELTKTKMRFTDADLSEPMNMLWEIPNWEMYYPKVVFEQDTSKTKPNMLAIGDSFTQSFFGFYNHFGELLDTTTSQYWYFNRRVTWPAFHMDRGYIEPRHLDIEKELKDRDVVLLLSTEINYDDIGFGFVDMAYLLFKYPERYSKEARDKRIATIKSKILHDPVWLKSMEEKAKKNKRPLDVQIQMDAEWMVDEEAKKLE